ncbi:MAG: ribose-phosphate pyrophosphokinase [Elusimicrobia bacterium]|nr:ribose-phosphate pyrophosphokinase [Elusimicrobiota bacterium]
MPSPYGSLKIFSGNSNPALAQEICRYLRVPLGRARVRRFADGEISAKIAENVRGCDCFLIQSTCPPVNENAMELLILLDTFRRASAERISAVIPYFGYARADRKTEPRVPISAKLMANLLTTAGANRVLTLDLHAGQIQGFFDIPVDHLYAMPVFLEHLRKKKLFQPAIVSPDVGGVERARAFAKRLNAGLVIIDKRRPKPNQASIYHVIGEVRGKTTIILDDMIDTGGTLIQVASALKKKGARRILAASSHGVFSNQALEKIADSAIEEVIITNTIPLRQKSVKNVRTLSVAPLLGEAIRRNHLGESVSALFV